MDGVLASLIASVIVSVIVSLIVSLLVITALPPPLLSLFPLFSQ